MLELLLSYRSIVSLDIVIGEYIVHKRFSQMVRVLSASLTTFWGMGRHLEGGVKLNILALGSSFHNPPSIAVEETLLLYLRDDSNHFSQSRMCGVMVITFPSHGKGSRFDPWHVQD